jgi:hypothetical protein
MREAQEKPLISAVEAVQACLKITTAGGMLVEHKEARSLVATLTA